MTAPTQSQVSKVELSRNLVPLEDQDVVCNAYHWRMPTDDPTFIYAINSATGCNAFDCRINRGVAVDQETVSQIAKLMFAAPDLLAALVKLVANDEIRALAASHSRVFASYHDAQAAIAKATGATP